MAQGGLLLLSAASRAARSLTEQSLLPPALHSFIPVPHKSSRIKANDKGEQRAPKEVRQMTASPVERMATLSVRRASYLEHFGTG